MDRADAGTFSIRYQGASGNYAYQTLEKCGRLCAAFLWNHRAVGSGRQARASSISIAAQYESRYSIVKPVPGDLAESRSGGFRIPARVMVYRRHILLLETAQSGAVRR